MWVIRKDVNNSLEEIKISIVLQSNNENEMRVNFKSLIIALLLINSDNEIYI